MGPYVAGTSLLINAPIELIWSVMLDLARYKDWNPFIVRVTDIPPQLTVGKTFTLHVKFSNGTSTTSKEKVTTLVPPCKDASAGLRKAVWAYRYAGAVNVVRSTRFQWLEEAVQGGGSTLYRTEAEYTGVGAALVPLAQVQDGFERHAAALKARAESLAGN